MSILPTIPTDSPAEEATGIVLIGLLTGKKELGKMLYEDTVLSIVSIVLDCVITDSSPDIVKWLLLLVTLVKSEVSSNVRLDGSKLEAEDLLVTEVDGVKTKVFIKLTELENEG